MTPRSFDHAVLPVESLEVSRVRYEALGFKVAGDAQHPFGTENACVFFADGTYLEPLAIGQRETCEETATKGNVFTKLDQTYRFRVGDNGFSALVFKSETADQDHIQFGKLGLSAGKKLMFGRTFVDGHGNKGRATFKLAFARDDRAPEMTLITCQRINTPAVDRSSLTGHTNGVTGIKEIVLSEFAPSDFQYFLQPVLGNRDTPTHSFGMEVAAANLTINALTPEGLLAMFGVKRKSAERGLVCEGIVFSVSDRAKLETALKASNISARDRGRYWVVDAAPGQGAFSPLIYQANRPVVTP